MATPYQESPEETNARPGYHLHPRQVEAAQLLGLLPGGPRAGLPPVEEMFYGGSSGGGKRLEITTPIATPDGFVPLQDIHAGSIVFGRDGFPCRVVAESEEAVAPAWRLTFDDGSWIIADDDHRWLTYTANDLASLTSRTDAWRARRRAARPSRALGNKSEQFRAAISARNSALSWMQRLPLPTGAVRTTAEIVATLRVEKMQRANHAIPVTAPLLLPERDLPIDPYVLGLWLGDGTSGAGALTTMDASLAEAVVQAGFPITKVHSQPNNRASTYCFQGLRPKLRLLGVLRKKRVPLEYLWASEAQRRALLAGLLDTDGYVENASIGFVNTNRQLTDSVAHLARSLGCKIQIRERRAKLYGVDCGPIWSVKFASPDVLFHLPRKAEKQSLASRQTTRFRYIIGAERIRAARMKCLQVNTPDGLFLAGESLIPTHNSFLCRAVGVAVCVQWSGIRVPIFRRKYVELNDTFIPWIQQEVRPPIAKYNRERHELVFANGSVLMFRHCEYEHNVFDYLTAEWGGLIIDQSEMFSPFMLSFLRHRVRQPLTVKDAEGKPWRPIMLYTANPGGPGHEFFRTGFVDVRLDSHGTQIMGQEGEGQIIEPGTVYLAPPKEGGQRRCYLPARLEDNPSLDKEEYERRLMGLPEHLRKAYMTGDWHVVAGAFFSEWRPLDDEGRPWHLWPLDTLRKHYSIPEDATFPPRDWVCWTATDGGFADPWCTLWLTRAPDKRLIIYRERYGARIGIPDQARRIKEAEELTGERIVVRKADPAMFNRRANLTVSDAEVYAANGVYLERATNAREPGWRRVREVLAEVLDDGFPRLVIVDGRCPNLVRTLPAMLTDTRHHEDIADGQEDHASDVIRYLTMPALATPLERKQFNIATVRMRPQEVDYRLGITGLRSSW